MPTSVVSVRAAGGREGEEGGRRGKDVGIKGKEEDSHDRESQKHTHRVKQACTLPSSMLNLNHRENSASVYTYVASLKLFRVFVCTLNHL